MNARTNAKVYKDEMKCIVVCLPPKQRQRDGWEKGRKEVERGFVKKLRWLRFDRLASIVCLCDAEAFQVLLQMVQTRHKVLGSGFEARLSLQQEMPRKLVQLIKVEARPNRLLAAGLQAE